VNVSGECQMIMTTNDSYAIKYLERIVPKSVAFTSLSGISFSCQGPKCFKQNGTFAHLSATMPDEPGPLYSEIWCSRCGAVYLITWKHGDEPIRVERRGWRTIESDGSYGRLHGKENDE
jgi:hypothetical protein